MQQSASAGKQSAHATPAHSSGANAIPPYSTAHSGAESKAARARLTAVLADLNPAAGKADGGAKKRDGKKDGKKKKQQAAAAN